MRVEDGTYAADERIEQKLDRQRNLGQVVFQYAVQGTPSVPRTDLLALA